MKKGKLLPEGYIPRLIDNALSARLEQTGAVEVTGTMWCGASMRPFCPAQSLIRCCTIKMLTDWKQMLLLN